MSTSKHAALGDMPDVLTAREAASVLRISLNSVYDVLRRGEIPSVRVGQRYLVPKQQLAKLIGASEPEKGIAGVPQVAPAGGDPVDDFCAALARLLKGIRDRSQR